MDANDHIGPLVVPSDIHGIPRHALLERFEAERLQRQLVHPEAERRGSKFIEPFPQKGILGHDFVQGNVLVEREEWSVVLYQSRSVSRRHHYVIIFRDIFSHRVDVNDIAVDRQRKLRWLGLVQDIEGVSKCICAGPVSTSSVTHEHLYRTCLLFFCRQRCSGSCRGR